MTVIDAIHQIQAEQDAIDAAFVERLWAWMPDTTGEVTMPCDVCGSPVPESMTNDSGLCVYCSAQ